MSCRPTPTSFPVSHMRRTRSYSQSLEHCFGAFSTRAGSMRSARMHPDAPMYTFWDYMRNRWQRDAGLRIDHLLLNPKAAKRLVDAGIDRDVRGERTRAITLRPGSRCATKTARQSKPVRRASKPVRTTVKRSASPASGPERRPLLVIDGDLFAHRSYHALPKTILRRGRKPAGAILGFANLLLRLYREEQPRAVLVAWDTLEVPTYRHKKFPAYQSGREFDDALLRAARSHPGIRRRMRLSERKGAGLRGRRFPRCRGARRRKTRRHRAGGERRPRHVSARLGSHHHPLSLRAGEMARVDPAEVRARYGVEPAQVPDFIALRGDPSDKLPGAPGVGATGAATLLQRYGTLEAALRLVVFQHRPKTCGSSDRLPLWIERRRCRASAVRSQLGVRQPPWRENGS